MNTCVNCGNPSDSAYCPECGQKMRVNRVTLNSIVGEFFSKWIGFDNQFARTIFELTTNPGKVIQAYLKGNRVKYLGPLAYLVIMSAILILSFDIYGLEVSDFLKENTNSFRLGQQELTLEQEKSQQKIQELIAKNFRFFSAVMIPFFALAMGWFYRKEKLNYVERLVVATYMSSHSMWITMIMLGVFAWFGHLYNLHAVVLVLFYFGYVLHTTFPRKNYFISLLRSIGIYVTALVLFLLFIFIAIIGIVILKSKIMQS